MIEIKDRIQCPAAIAKITTAEAAAAYFQDGMNVGVSGFTSSGYPKVVPQALAQRIAGGDPLKITLCSGASLGPEVDTVLTRADAISMRTPYQTNKEMRTAINAGKMKYMDLHLSHSAQMIRYGFLANRQDIDLAVVECCLLKELPDGQVGIVPTTSVGNAASFVQSAKQVIIEVNVAQPASLLGMHDSCVPLDPPNRKVIAIEKPEDRIGTEFIPCPLDKIVAIVPCDVPDQTRDLKEIDADSQAMGHNLVEFLEAEVKAGRLPANLLPLQSGVGSVANAVLNGLVHSNFKDLTVYTEVIQDGILDLIDVDKLRIASGTALSPSPACLRRFYANVEKYKPHILLRPQEIANSPEVIRRLGVIAMNTAIEVDMYGNVNSTHIGGSKLMNGIGGSCDFARNGFLTVFFTTSMAKHGAISSVVPFCSHIDSTEHDVDIIVSERGVADLRGLSPKERAPIIIDKIANPKYQPELQDYFERACKACGNSQTPHLLGEAFAMHQRFLQTGTMEKK